MPKCLKCLPVLILLALSTRAFSQYDPNHFDPDNAAHWYRKAFEQMDYIDVMEVFPAMMMRADPNEPNEKVLKYEQNLRLDSQIQEYIDRKTPLTKEIEDYIVSQKEVIDLFIKASKCSFCEWGYGNLAEIEQLKKPIRIQEVSQLRNGLRDLLANSVLFAQKKDFNESIQSYLASFIVSEHYNLLMSGTTQGYFLNDRSIIRCTQNLLPLLSGQESNLQNIADQLKKFIQNRPSRENRFDEHTNDYAQIIIVEREQILKRIKDIDRTEMILTGQLDIQQYYTFRQKLKEVWLLPFDQAYPKVQEIKDFLPAPERKDGKIYLDINSFVISLYEHNLPSDFYADYMYRTQDNVVYIASKNFLKQAQTGQWPQKLPLGMPEDPFSGKDFIYETTSSAFILRCQGADLRTNKVHEYEFKLPTK